MQQQQQPSSPHSHQQSPQQQYKTNTQHHQFQQESMQIQQQSIKQVIQQDLKLNQLSQTSSNLTQTTSQQKKQRFGHKPSIAYRSQIDGLRSVAILPVIAFHYSIFTQYTSGGFGGVDVFFVISGFLVNSIIISDLLKQKFSIKIFYERRVRRLFPAIFTVLTICLLIGYYIYFQKDRYQQLVKQQISALLSAANIYFYQNRNNMGDGYFTNNAQTWPFLHFWSLGVQEQFYMVTPLILMLIMKLTMRFMSKNRFTLIFFVYSIVTILISFILSVIMTKKVAMFAFYLLPCRAWELGLGGFVAILLHDSTVQKIKQSKKQFFQNNIIFSNGKLITIILEILSWSGLVMIMYSYAHYTSSDAFPGYKALLPCGGTALFIACNFVRYQKPKPKPLQQQGQQMSQIGISSSVPQQNTPPKRKMLTSARFLSFGLFRWIGQISYSLYLWHWPVWVFINYVIQQHQINNLNRAFCVVLSILLADLSTTKIQNPIRNKKRVSTKALWRGFAIIWVLLMIFLIINRVTKIGGVDFSKYYIKPTDNSIYPKFDAQGFYIKNAYRTLRDRQLNLQKMGDQQILGLDQKYTIKDNKAIIFNSYLSGLELEEKGICLAALGSSHTHQHSKVLESLAIWYNVSVGVIADDSDVNPRLKGTEEEQETWKMREIQRLKPKMIFIQQHWIDWGENVQQKIRQLIDPLLSLQNPPKYIGIFGDNPHTGLNISNNIPIAQQISQKYQQNEKTWDFFLKIPKQTVQSQTQIQKQINKFIQQNYKNKNINFYPHLHQFLQNSKTGEMQLVGSQVDGKLLFRNDHVLSVFGSERYKEYFREKMFKSAKEKYCQ